MALNVPPATRRLLAVLLLAALPIVAVTRDARAATGTCNGLNNAQSMISSSVQTSAYSQVGTYNTWTVTLTTASGAPATGYCVTFTQNAGGASTTTTTGNWPQFIYTDATYGRASVTWTSSVVGSDSITATPASDDAGNKETPATITHRWTAPTPTPSSTSPSASRSTSSPTPTVTPTPNPTTSPPTTPPTTPATTPTTSNSSPSASPTTTSPTPTHSSSRAPPPPVSSSTPPLQLQLDRPSSLPGGSAKVSGRNCPADATVNYTVQGQPAGSTTALSDGTFSSDVQLPTAPIGQYPLTVTCGPDSATVPIDLVVASSEIAAPGAGLTAGAVLVFFVLLGSIVLSRSSKPRAKLAPTSAPEGEPGR